MNEINVQELKNLFDNGEDFILLDVREDAEFEVARIDGSTHIPMSVLIGRLDEINKEKKDHSYVSHWNEIDASLYVSKK